ncbi:MAG: hypothetical protein IJ323_06940 [Clostridia bacterium]|nr:hypothetical protein [Clostridia bacterium]
MEKPNEIIKVKKPFYKKWWVWVIAVLIFLAYIGSNEEEDETSNNSYSGEEEQTVFEENIDYEEVVLDESEYKSKCCVVYYDDISRYPSNYEGVMAVFTGQVIQVQESGNNVILRVDVTEEDFGFWTDTIYVDYQKKNANEGRVLVDDIITMYGTLNGIKSYTTVMNSQVSIPHFLAEYIDIN